jgi:hypothetical protein
VIGFFNAYRNAERVTRNCLRDIAQQFQNWCSVARYSRDFSHVKYDGSF